MNHILIILFSIVTFSSSAQFATPEMTNHFSEPQIVDLHKITDFFKSQICANHSSDFKSCFESLPNLVDYGYSPIFELINFESQKELYQEISKPTFYEIWRYCPTKNLETNTEYHSLCAAGFGKAYADFLIEVGLNNTSVAAYADRLIESGDFEFNLHVPKQIYNRTSDFDLNDKNIQVLLAIHFLSINDQMFRSKL